MKDIVELVKVPHIEHNFLDELKVKIITRLKSVNLIDAKFKFEPKNILYVCVLIESSLDKKHKINKRDFLIEIFKEIYGLSMEDEITIKQTVDLLHLTKKIKKKSYYKLWCVSLLECFRL